MHTLFTSPHSDDPMWKAVRKALNPAFNPNAIRRATMTGSVIQAKPHSSIHLLSVKHLRLLRHKMAT